MGRQVEEIIAESAINQKDPITVTLTPEQWRTVMDGLADGSCYRDNPGWCYGCETPDDSELCDDHARDLEQSRQYEQIKTVIADQM